MRLAFRFRLNYLSDMVRQYEYQPCIPTRGTEVPAGPDWLHEIKHDGYRLIVQREGKRVRLLTRRGYDWSDRYPRVAEAALRLRKSSFVIDGEAVVLGSNGISDFDALHGGRRDAEVRLYAFDLLMDDGVDMRDSANPQAVAGQAPETLWRWHPLQ
jgi:bifunctional non-homologous end joining protein LigD